MKQLCLYQTIMLKTATNRKIEYIKIAKICLGKLCVSSLKIVNHTQFSLDLNSLGQEFEVIYVFVKKKKF